MDADLMLNDRTHGYITPEEDEKHVPPYKSPLMSLTSLEVLDWFVDKFAERGILVLLDMHCLDTGGTNKSPVFFNDAHPVERVLDGWAGMAKRYGSKWNVLGADVFNEPFGATWAEGAATDMDAFAVRAASAIHANAPNWLIFVEGSSKSPNCTENIDGDDVVCGYGDNLKGVSAHPVQLGKADKLVYSPHTYGPSQHDRAEFHNAVFPSNMPDVWDNHWGYIRDSAGSPAVVLGEWGGPLADANLKWMNALADYLTSKRMQSNFFWCLNQDSDPVGIVTNWAKTPMAVDDAKLKFLARLTPSPTNFTLPIRTPVVV
jgi:endoglucanase